MKTTLRLDEVAPNPIARKLDDLTRPTLAKIGYAIDDVTGDYRFEHGGFNGWAYVEVNENGERFDWRTATNEQATFVEAEWIRVVTQLDLRQNLSEQVSQWLRAEAALMLEAADAVDAVKDSRNLNKIIAIVGVVPEVNVA